MPRTRQHLAGVMEKPLTQEEDHDASLDTDECSILRAAGFRVHCSGLCVLSHATFVSETADAVQHCRRGLGSIPV